MKTMVYSRKKNLSQKIYYSYYTRINIVQSLISLKRSKAFH